MSDEYERIKLGKDTSGRDVIVSRRTKAMLDEVKRRVGPTIAAKLTIVQGSWRSIGGGSGAQASAGTHNRDGVLDFRTWNLTAAERNKVILVARQVGFAAWYRTKAQGFDPHMHWVDCGSTELHSSAAQQVDQYERGRNGLARQGKDDGPHVGVVRFKYKPAKSPAPKPPAAKAPSSKAPTTTGDDMAVTQAEMNAIATAVANRVIGSQGNGQPLTIGQALGRMNWLYEQWVESGSLNAQADEVQASMRSVKADVDDLQARL